MAQKILVVLTGTEKYPNLNRATGVWLGEIVHFVEKVEKAGFEVDYVSPSGGYTPVDPHSLAMAEPVDWEWYQNKAFMNRLGATLKPSEVDPADYAAIYFVGGHGVLWDFADNAELQALSRKIYEKGGIVSAVCHGAVGLLNIRLSDGTLLIKGREVTGFSDEEERLAELDQHVPFLTEDELVKRGAIYKKADKPWAAFAIADGRVVTGILRPAERWPIWCSSSSRLRLLTAHNRSSAHFSGPKRMDVYQGWFNLREGASDLDVASAFEAYMRHLQSRGLIVGWRLLRCKLGLAPSTFGEFQFLIEARDLAQLDAAFRVVSTRAGDIESLHQALNSKVKDAVFALYRDFPDPHRRTGEERF